MALYIDPPSGIVQLGRLERYARTRLAFLLKVARCHGNAMLLRDVMTECAAMEAADCLIEGSKKDEISHFLLRLACCSDPEMTQFFIQSETSFFNYRMSCMTEQELHKNVVKPLRKLMGFCKEKERLWHPLLTDIAAILSAMTQHLKIEQIICHVVDGLETNGMVLPFEFVPSLVASRAIRVCKGRAFVPFTKFYVVLTSIFEKLMHYGMELARLNFSAASDDRRFHLLFRQTKAVFRLQCPILYPSLSGPWIVTCDDVDSIVHQVPLCMSRLHNVLRKRHRLKHADRIQYTLFLKEIGMPVHEALQFWRQEYSKVSSCHGDNCGHSWQKDSRRYTYNIRHLYGLEGSKVNYRAHCCGSLQGRTIGHQEVGGCPFSNFNVLHLSSEVEAEGITGQQRSDIIAMTTENLPGTACQIYLKEKFVITAGIKRDATDWILSQTKISAQTNLSPNQGSKTMSSPSTTKGDKETPCTSNTCCHGNESGCRSVDSSVDLEELMNSNENCTRRKQDSQPSLIESSQLAFENEPCGIKERDVITNSKHDGNQHQQQTNQVIEMSKRKQKKSCPCTILAVSSEHLKQKSFCTCPGNQFKKRQKREMGYSFEGVTSALEPHIHRDVKTIEGQNSAQKVGSNHPSESLPREDTDCNILDLKDSDTKHFVISETKYWNPNKQSKSVSVNCCDKDSDIDPTNHMSCDLLSQSASGIEDTPHPANENGQDKAVHLHCCYVHDSCLPLTQGILDKSFTTIEQVAIKKPSDFYFTFNRLLDGLKRGQEK